MTATMDDLDRVDWLAVEFVCGGTRMRLGDDKATATAAILSIGYHLTVDQIAERIDITARQVLRILIKYGAANCPFCTRRLLIPHDGVVPSHVRDPDRWCPMSGYPVTDTARAEQIRSDRQAIKRYR